MHTQASCRTRRVLLGALAFLLLAGCGPRADVEPRRQPDDGGRRVDTGPCDVTLSPAGVVTVDGAEVDVRWSGDGRVDLVTWAPGEGTRLVAFRPDPADPPRPEADDVLWRVTCRPDPRATVLVTRPGASFGWAALDPGGRLLYFTDEAGVSALDTDTRRIRTVTEAPRVPEDCWAAARGGERPLAEDRVVGYDASRRELIVHRGGACGYEGDRVAREIRVRHPSDPSRREIRTPHPVATVAVDARGRLWLGDAGRCDEPGVTDPSTPGVTWRSDDGGDTWTRVPVRASEHPMVTAAAAVFADPGRPGSLIVYSALCESRGAILGGSVYLSHDGGRAWRLLDLPEALRDSPASVGQGLAGAAMPGRGADTLVVWSEAGDAWVTPDEGVTWLPHSGDVPPMPSEEVVLDGVRFRPTDEGLLRVRGDEAERVFPGR
ncbi:MAG: WD40/YVTN/BNR-like repeat-containing protein [Myxococcota bacterium]